MSFVEKKVIVSNSFTKLFSRTFLGIIFAASFVFVSHVDAATLRLSPASATTSVGKSIKVRVVVGSDGASINGVSGVLSYTPETLTLSSISKSGSVLNLWATEPKFSNAAGTVSFEGVSLSGFSGSDGTVVTLTFVGKAEGTGSIKVTPSSEVLANDGKGTNLLTSEGIATITVGKATAGTTSSETPSSTETPVEETPEPSTSGISIPQITEYQSHTTEGQFLVIKGRADPHAIISIYISNISDSTTAGAQPDITNLKTTTATALANASGKFVFVSNEPVTAGTYIITAQEKTMTGAQSDLSNPVQIKVTKGALFVDFSNRALGITLGILFAILIASIVLLCRRISILRKPTKK